MTTKADHAEQARAVDMAVAVAIEQLERQGGPSIFVAVDPPKSGDAPGLPGGGGSHGSANGVGGGTFRKNDWLYEASKRVSDAMSEPFDLFDGSHTKAEVQDYLLDFYSGHAYRGLARIDEWVLATNSTGRKRESEGTIEVAMLFAKNTERRYLSDNPSLSAMDVLALDVVLPWADVQTVTTCGGDEMSPIYCVGVSRLPTASPNSVAMTVGHFILLDATDNSPNIVLDARGNYVPSRDLLVHELTHMYRSRGAAHMDEFGMDDREWYFGYVYDNSWLGDGVEENCAYQVGMDGDVPLDSLVNC